MCYNIARRQDGTDQTRKVAGILDRDMNLPSAIREKGNEHVC